MNQVNFEERYCVGEGPFKHGISNFKGKNPHNKNNK